MTATQTMTKPHNGSTTAQEAEFGALVPQPQPPVIASLALQMGNKPNLAAALAKAILDCGAVPHDARNEFHKYDYTSAEASLGAARSALAKNGIVLVPGEASVNGTERAGPDRFALVQQ